MLAYPFMPQTDFDLARAALDEMHHEGFHPDFPGDAQSQLNSIRATLGSPQPGLRDMRDLLWSSIDNATSRDLDQIEFAEQTPSGIRVLVAIADVDSRVTIGTPLDLHAASETTSV